MGRDLVRTKTLVQHDVHCNVINKNENVDDRTKDKVDPTRPYMACLKHHRKQD